MVALLWGLVMGIKIRVKKNKVSKQEEMECDEIIYSQVSRYWPNKSQVLSYLRGRCSPDNPTAMYLKRILELRMQ